MSSGDIRPNKEPIIEYPEGYEDMVKKHKEREEQQVDRLLKRRKVESEDELKALAKQAIVTRMTRLASEHTALKDRTIIREEEGQDIKEQRKALNAEIKSIAKALLQGEPEAAKSSLRDHKIKIQDTSAGS